MAGRCSEQLHLCSSSNDGETRGARWFRLANAHCSKHDPTQRSQCTSQWSNFWELQRVLSEEEQIQISKDIARTFSEHVFCTDSFLTKLERLLSVIAYNHPDGYTQSMNYVAGMVLHQLTQDIPGVQETQVYWFCSTLFTCLFPGYHTRDMQGVQVDTRMLRDLFHEIYPCTFQALEEDMITPDVLCIEWLLGIFTTSLHLEVAACLWDVLISLGRNQMLRACLVLLDWSSDPSNWLPEEASKGTCYAIKRTLFRLTEEQVKHTVSEGIAKIMDHCNDQKMNQLREHHKAELRNEFERRQLKTAIYKLQSSTTLELGLADRLQTKISELKHSQNDGLTREQFGSFLCEYLVDGKDVAELFFDILDQDNSQDLTAPEILRGLALCTSRTVNSFIEQACELFSHREDVQHTGLDQQETASMVTWMMRAWKEPPTDEQVHKMVQKMFATLDLDHSGTLEPEELIQGCAAFPEITQCYSKLSTLSKVAMVTDVKSDPNRSQTISTSNRSCCVDVAKCAIQ